MLKVRCISFTIIVSVIIALFYFGIFFHESGQMSSRYPRYINHCPGASHRNKKVLSYSIFGNNSFNTYAHLIENFTRDATRLKMYKEWGIRLYHDGVFPWGFIQKVKNINSNVDFCDVRDLQSVYPNMSHVNGRIWRFISMADDALEISCSRDADSPLLLREVAAVQEWMISSKIFHSMRDHYQHRQPILGGMWCFRNTKNINLGKELMWKIYLSSAHRDIEKSREEYKYQDQILLERIVWPAIKDDVMQHDSFHCEHYNGSIPFPTQRRVAHVGCKWPCPYFKNKCPKQCRPVNHPDWKRC